MKTPIKPDILKIYTDGAARGNPGPGACAFVLIRDDTMLYSQARYLGRVTNNTAEYEAVIGALKKAGEYTKSIVYVHSDSNLLVNQLNGDWQIKKEHLRRLYEEVMKQKRLFEDVRFIKVPRENRVIREADRLCNECLDKNVGQKSGICSK